jgi:hypothetical protein
LRDSCENPHAKGDGNSRQPGRVASMAGGPIPISRL